jgi:dephospho-CoA kinase
MLTVGLTGNYGMGKSAVLKMFRELGAVTIDADEIVDGLLRNGPVLERIRTALGDEVFLEEGGLDRVKVAGLIFKDDRKRDVLEGILHPLVYDEIEEFLKGVEKADGGDRVVVVEIPLMFEKGHVERFQKTITVHAEEPVVFQRLGEKGIGREKAEERLRTQMDIDEKMRRSDFVIDNSGPVEETATQAREIYSKLLKEKKALEGG